MNLENLITVNSTPRNRLLADVMAKTGIVERSGQGIDKIFYRCLTESKPEPDYSHSDYFQVELRLSSIVEDKAFALFIRYIQEERLENEKLSVHEIITLNKIRKGVDKNNLDPIILIRLEGLRLIERIGKTSGQKIILSKDYYSFTGNKVAYTINKPIDSMQVGILINQHLKEFSKAKMGDFEHLFQAKLTREQVRYIVSKLVESGSLDMHGKGKGSFYVLGKKMNDDMRLMNRALELGFEEMKKRGELPSM